MVLLLDAKGRVSAVFKGPPGVRVHLVFDVTGYYR